MTTKIIQASSEHLEDAATLFDAYRCFYGQSSDLEAARRFLADRFKQKDSVLLLAYHAEKAVGFTQLYPSFSSVGMQRTWILNDLFVIDSARKLGVATSLLQHAQQFGIETNAARLTLATAPENQPAQALYQKLGWVADGFLHYKLDL
ncbi:MAG: GNAT family N-acetyltransferase [Blastopirellula sp.]|nr:MAG: GNAT family N-acetyltransferase [Blastopirellula sp.]